jgi:hypothetical protein
MDDVTVSIEAVCGDLPCGRFEDALRNGPC